MKTKLIRKPVGWLIALALWMFAISIPAQIIYSNIGQNTFGTQKATDLRTRYPGGAQVVNPITGATIVELSGNPTITGTVTTPTNVQSTATGGSLSATNSLALSPTNAIYTITTNFPIIVSGILSTGTVGTAAYANNSILCPYNNVLGPPQELPNVVWQNGQGTDLSMFNIIVSNANWAASCRIYFFASTNVTWYSNTMTYAKMFNNYSNKLYYVDMPAFSIDGAGGDAATSLNITDTLSIKTAPSTKSIFYLIKMNGAATPVANQPYYLQVTSKPR